MNVEVEAPDLGPDGGDQATVEEWHFDEGEFVAEGDVLVDLICDAGGIAVTCPHSGILQERLIEEDEAVRTGEPLAVIECREDEDEDEEEDEDGQDEVSDDGE